MAARVYAQALAEVLEETPEEEVPEVARRLKRELKKRGEMSRAGAVLEEFQKLWERRTGTPARAVSAQELPAGVKEELARDLAKEGYGARFETDERVGGGLAIFLGTGYLIDGTLRRRFQRMRERLFTE